MRLAETPPAYCSGCFQAKPDQRHVDVEVSWDGPVIQDGIRGDDGEVAHTIPVAIDDLVLCEDCLKTAAGLIGLTDPGDVAAHVQQLEESNRLLTEKLRGSEDYLGKLEQAVAAKPEAPKRARRPVAA